jgi:hypothetical protein
MANCPVLPQHHQQFLHYCRNLQYHMLLVFWFYFNRIIYKEMFKNNKSKTNFPKNKLEESGALVVVAVDILLEIGKVFSLIKQLSFNYFINTRVYRL